MRTRRWPVVVGLVGAWLAMAVPAGPTPVSADDRFSFGTKDLGIAGGYSLSHDRTGVEQVDGIHVLPHFGLFLTKHLELLAEPTLAHLRSDSETATVAGFSVLGRLVIDTGTRVVPYLEVGGGFLAGRLNFPQTDCDVNYVLQGGPGVLIFLTGRTAISVGARFHHVSNGGACDRNLGMNSSLFAVGLSHFFP